MSNRVLPSFPLCVLCVLCGSFPLCLVAEEDKNGPKAVSAADLESRRKALERWALEPLAIETSAYRLLLDRHDGSFVLRDRRSGVKLFSSWRHRGFASVRLADGRELPVDRVEKLEVEEKRIRFRGASSSGELPPLSFELSSPPDVDLLELRFEVPEESRGEISRVRLLDDALWIADADGGGAAVGRENGEWYEASRDGALDIRLTRLAPFATASGEAYSLPLVALLKGEAAFLLFWETPSAVVEVQRRRIEDRSFPGRGGIFVSLEFSTERGEARLVPLGAHRLGVVDA